MIDRKLAGRLLDRIADLARGNEARTLEYLDMQKTAAERQKALADRREQDGIRPYKLWVSAADAEALRERFTGARGGIDWAKVIAAALGRSESPTSEPRPSDPAEPIPYWKPDGVRDTRCQAATLRGERCRQEGKLVARWLLPDGKIGEFSACKQHYAEATPHPSVLAKPR